MKRNQKIIGFVLIIAIIIIAAIYYWHFKSANNSATAFNTDISTTSGTTSEPVIENSEQDTKDTLIYSKFTEVSKEIYQSDFNGKNIKLLFTDKNDDQKINLFGGLAYLSREVLVFSGGDPVGKLEVIKTDGSHDKNIIVDSFGRPLSLNISPDGKTITYVNFSNAETDYGYHLYTISRKGTNRREITKNSSEISSPSINNDSTKIAFIKTDAAGHSEIDIADIASGQTSTIYSANNKIVTLSWNGDDKISFTKANDKLIGGEIIICNKDGSKTQKLLSNDKNIPVFVFVSSDSNNFAFLVNSYNNTIDLSKSGDIDSARISGKNQIKIDNANLILGWLP